MTAAVSPQPALRAAGFVSYRILIGRRNAVGHHVSHDGGDVCGNGCRAYNSGCRQIERSCLKNGAGHPPPDSRFSDGLAAVYAEMLQKC